MIVYSADGSQTFELSGELKTKSLFVKVIADASNAIFLCTSQTSLDTVVKKIDVLPLLFEITCTGSFSATLGVSISGNTFADLKTFTEDTVYQLPCAVRGATWRLVVNTNAGLLTASML